MSFFSSDVVRKEAHQIMELQSALFALFPTIETMEKGELLEYFDAVLSLIEQQKIFAVRANLASPDDEEAQEFKNSLIESAAIFGMKPNTTLAEFYDTIKEKMLIIRQRAEDGTLDFGSPLTF